MDTQCKIIYVSDQQVCRICNATWDAGDYDYTCKLNNTYNAPKPRRSFLDWLKGWFT